MKGLAGYYGRLYRAFMKVSILDSIQYRASGAIWMIGSILEPVIFLIVWSTVAKARGGEVQGYTANEFAAYYIVLMFVNHLTFTWVMQTFQYRIQFGQLSYELLRPVHPIHSDVTANIAYKIVQMVIMLPAVAVLVWLFEPSFDFTLAGFLVALPALFLAFLTRFLLEWSLALVAFWTTRVAAINQMYFAIMMFFSGRVAPIALLPGVVQSASSILPFYYVTAFPVELVTGRLDQEAIISGYLALGGWLVVSFVVVRFAWRRAVRNYAAVGA